MGGSTIYRKFTTRCGTTLYLPAHGYHILKAGLGWVWVTRFMGRCENI